MRPDRDVKIEGSKVSLGDVVKVDLEKGELRVREKRCVVFDPIARMAKFQSILGEGTGSLLYTLWYQDGVEDYRSMAAKGIEGVLKELADRQGFLGWGKVHCSFQEHPLEVTVTIRNPIVKDSRWPGAMMYSGYWAGVFATHYGVKLRTEKITYDDSGDKLIVQLVMTGR